MSALPVIAELNTYNLLEPFPCISTKLLTWPFISGFAMTCIRSEGFSAKQSNISSTAVGKGVAGSMLGLSARANRVGNARAQMVVASLFGRAAAAVKKGGIAIKCSNVRPYVDSQALAIDDAQFSR